MGSVQNWGRVHEARVHRDEGKNKKKILSAWLRCTVQTPSIFLYVTLPLGVFAATVPGVLNIPWSLDATFWLRRTEACSSFTRDHDLPQLHEHGPWLLCVPHHAPGPIHVHLLMVLVSLRGVIGENINNTYSKIAFSQEQTKERNSIHFCIHILFILHSLTSSIHLFMSMHCKSVCVRAKSGYIKKKISR